MSDGAALPGTEDAVAVLVPRNGDAVELQPAVIDAVAVGVEGGHRRVGVVAVVHGQRAVAVRVEGGHGRIVVVAIVFGQRPIAVEVFAVGPERLVAVVAVVLGHRAVAVLVLLLHRREGVVVVAVLGCDGPVAVHVVYGRGVVVVAVLFGQHPVTVLIEGGHGGVVIVAVVLGQRAVAVVVQGRQRRVVVVTVLFGQRPIAVRIQGRHGRVGVVAVVFGQDAVAVGIVFQEGRLGIFVVAVAGPGDAVAVVVDEIFDGGVLIEELDIQAESADLKRVGPLGTFVLSGTLGVLATVIVPTPLGPHPEESLGVFSQDRDQDVLRPHSNGAAVTDSPAQIIEGATYADAQAGCVLYRRDAWDTGRHGDVEAVVGGAVHLSLDELSESWCGAARRHDEQNEKCLL